MTCLNIQGEGSQMNKDMARYKGTSERKHMDTKEKVRARVNERSSQSNAFSKIV